MSLDLSSSSGHYSKIMYLENLQVDLLREEEKIRATLVDIQDTILLNMDALHMPKLSSMTINSPYLII